MKAEAPDETFVDASIFNQDTQPQPAQDNKLKGK
jgi:hypothetical protein